MHTRIVETILKLILYLKSCRACTKTCRPPFLLLVHLEKTWTIMTRIKFLLCRIPFQKPKRYKAIFGKRRFYTLRSSKKHTNSLPNLVICFCQVPILYTLPLSYSIISFHLIANPFFEFATSTDAFAYIRQKLLDLAEEEDISVSFAAISKSAASKSSSSASASDVRF